MNAAVRSGGGRGANIRGGRGRRMHGSSRQRWSDAWQFVMVRALLAIIIVGGGLGLSAGEPTDVVRIVRAQATANDNAAPIGSQLGDDNALARHAAALDNETPVDHARRADRPAAPDVPPIFPPRSITPPANREADDEPFTASHCTPDRAEASF